MSLYDTLTGINAYTLFILIILLVLTFAIRVKKSNTKSINSIRAIIILILINSWITGWSTIYSVDGNKYKDRKVTFKNNQFLQVCNLKTVFKEYGMFKYYSSQYDCKIIKHSDLHIWKEYEKQFMRIGEVKPIDNNMTFTVIDLIKIESHGLMTGHGEYNTIMHYALLYKNRTYVIGKPDFEESREIK